MSRQLLMPKLGLTMTDAVVSEWHVADGDTFTAGTILVVVETDKIASEIEAEHDGRVERIRAAVGDTVLVGGLLAEIEGPEAAAGAEPAEDRPAPPAAPEVGIDLAASKPPSCAQPGTGRVVATPLARRMARDADVNLADIDGSGPRGRIKAADVAQSIESRNRRHSAENDVAPVAMDSPGESTASTTQPRSDAAYTGKRRQPTAREMTIARRLTEAKATVPHFYLTTEVEVTALEQWRLDIKDQIPGLRVTMTHLAVKAATIALGEEERFNTVWVDAGFLALSRIDIGLAVATDSGLLAPIVRDLAGNSLRSVVGKVDLVVGRARSDSLATDDVGGGALTISNAGMFDVTNMASIINPGQSAILGMGSVRPVFRPDADGKPVLRRELGLTLSCDHRVHDGASGLALLNRIRGLLESPIELLAT